MLGQHVCSSFCTQLCLEFVHKLHTLYQHPELQNKAEMPNFDFFYHLFNCSSIISVAFTAFMLYKCVKHYHRHKSPQWHSSQRACSLHPHKHWRSDWVSCIPEDIVFIGLLRYDAICKQENLRLGFPDCCRFPRWFLPLAADTVL